MASTRPLALRLPPVLLASTLVLGGLVTLPAVALIVAVFVRHHIRGYHGNVEEFLTTALPALIGYPFAAVLWFYCRRVSTTRWSWLLAVLGVVVVVAVSFWPLAVIGYGFYEEWLETQPGGKGYYR
ncbi:hypothetical protein [Micromonospora sp. NPDC049679]|uniref:hypothetical protein n=1 Tax=Micromonospora sp. NPDC049679 TaxID=3155920 RepID=UPI0033C7BC2E